MRNRMRKWGVLLLSASAGTLWLAGCTTGLATRDFLETTAVRVFFQTLATAFQAGVVNQG